MSMKWTNSYFVVEDFLGLTFAAVCLATIAQQKTNNRLTLSSSQKPFHKEFVEYQHCTSEVTNSAGTLQTPNANASEEVDKVEELIVVPIVAKHTAAKVGPRKSSTNSKAEESLTEFQNLKTQEKEAYPTGISEDTPDILAFRRELDKLAQKHLREVPKNKATIKKGVPLQAEQAVWLEDTDKKIDEQELEAHYSYMAKIQEVPTANLGTDTEPLEQVDSNVIPDLLDMCDNDIQADQNVIECDDERVTLANLIANLKLDVDENKKIQK
ncbi:hypothetical protein Tco_0341607 [Tanacetum coccineum]